MFVDQVKVYVKAGDGGDGCISFRREKCVPRGGPDGGDGGKGGDIVFEATSHQSTLIELRYQQRYTIKHARHGSGQNASGRSSPDRIIPVPVGTLIREAETEALIADLTQIGQRVIAAKGGRGGHGNSRFKSAINQAPRKAETGEEGEERYLHLELKLIADVGLVGAPNAGKSSLIAAITQAHPKVADYPFTTIEPNLGVAQWPGDRGQMKHFTLADIPGLIAGAHEGKGLGIKFLKHLERTSLLLHLVDVSEMADMDPVEDFEMIREEVTRYHHGMSEKPFFVAGTKLDIAGEGQKAEQLRSYCRERKIPFFEISSATGRGTRELIRTLGHTVEKRRQAITKKEQDNLQQAQDDRVGPDGSE